MSLDSNARVYLLIIRRCANKRTVAEPAIQNYDKVLDPLKERVKVIPVKLKSMRGQEDHDRDHRHRDHRYHGHQDSSDDEDYDRPRRRHTSRQEPRHSRDDGRWIEETYERKVVGRAKSAGRDGANGGGGRGLDRDRHRESYIDPHVVAGLG